MQPIYHIHPDPSRKPSGKLDQLIIDVSMQHLAIISLHETQLLYLDIYHFPTQDPLAAVDELSALIADHPLLQTSFEQVKVIYHTPESILVPDAFYQADTSDHLLHWQNGDAGDYFPMKDSLQSAGIQLLYAVPESLHHIMTINFPSANFVHAHAASILAKQEGNVIDIAVYPGEWICTFWKQGQLQMVRSLISSHADDICYMLLNICKQLNLKEDQLKLSIGGMIEQDDNTVSMLARFIPAIHWKEKAMIQGLNDQPDHFFTPLLNQSLCVL